MDQLGPGQRLQDIVLRPVYLRAVNAIVQPEQQLPCSLYFFREWLPRLGSLRWALVLALRCLCTNRQADGVSRGEVSRSQLAALLGVHEVTISRLLTTTRSTTTPGWRVLQPASKDDTATALLAKFIPRIRYKYARDPDTGATRRVGYIIDVVMDDPLTPEDEQRLAVMIAEQLLSGADYHPPETAASSTARDTQTTSSSTYQNATSAPEVNERLATSPSPPTLQPTTSRPTVNPQLAASTTVKAHAGPALTLTTNFNYRDITVPLNLSTKREIRRALTPLVDYAVKVLRDDHSVGMFYSTLVQLYPNSLELFTEALEESAAMAGWSQRINLGAVFVNKLKSLARDRGLVLRLGKGAEPTAAVSKVDDDVAAKVRATPTARLPDASVYLPDVGMSGAQVWQSILQELRRTASGGLYDMWLSNCRLVAVHDRVVVIGARNRLTCDWVRDRFQGPIARAAAAVLGRDVVVRCEVLGAEPAAGEVAEWPGGRVGEEEV